MINVVYDHQIFATQQFGGISRYIYEVAKRVDTSDGYRARIVAPIYFNSYLRGGQAPNIGLYVPQMAKTGNIIRTINNIASPLLLELLRPAVVHETYYQSFCVARRGTPTVLTVYDMVHERFRDQFSENDTTSRNKRAAVERAQHIVCISESTREDLIQFFGVPRSKTTVIYLGFTLTSIHTADHKNGDRGRPFILYVGHRGSWKNFGRFLTAYGSSSFLSREFALILFGGGPLGIAESKRIHDLKVPPGNVTQVSGNDDVLEALYRTASLFVYPSLCEGFGIPPLEAMSFNCPVACSNTSSIPEVVGDAAELFDPTSSEAIGAAMEKILGSEEVKGKLVKRGRERIKRFSWDKCASETLGVYRSVVS